MVMAPEAPAQPANEPAPASAGGPRLWVQAEIPDYYVPADHTQLSLLDSNGSPWVLDEHMKQVGRQGILAAREALRQAGAKVTLTDNNEPLRALDDQTREVGRRGVAAAREALRQAGAKAA